MYVSYVCMYVCMYMRMYVCMNVCVHVLTLAVTSSLYLYIVYLPLTHSYFIYCYLCTHIHVCYASTFWFLQLDIYVSMHNYMSLYSFISFVLSHFSLHHIFLVYLIAVVPMHFTYVMFITFIVTFKFLMHATHFVSHSVTDMHTQLTCMLLTTVTVAYCLVCTSSMVSSTSRE
jgi:hypothetical protein